MLKQNFLAKVKRLRRRIAENESTVDKIDKVLNQTPVTRRVRTFALKALERDQESLKILLDKYAVMHGLESTTSAGTSMLELRVDPMKSFFDIDAAIVKELYTSTLELSLEELAGRPLRILCHETAKAMAGKCSVPMTAESLLQCRLNALTRAGKIKLLACGNWSAAGE